MTYGHNRRKYGRNLIVKSVNTNSLKTVDQLTERDWHLHNQEPKSAYRTLEWNRKCGGSANSQHLQGRALDCYPPAVMFLGEFREQAKEFALADDRVGGFGSYRWGVHWDIRPRGSKLIVWNQVPAGTSLHERIV